MNLNLELYKVFYYVAVKGSITQAAEALSVSQPAISQAIRQLEQALGMPLFVRTGRGVRLTVAGEMLMSYVKPGYELILKGEQKIKEMLELDTGEIRIGASDMTLKYYLLPYLQQFHEEYPRIKLNVTNGPTPETLRYMQEGRIDFGVVSGPVSSRSEIRFYPVRAIRDIFVAGERFAGYRGRTLPLDVLEQLPVISLEKNTSTRRYVDHFLEENGISLNPEIELATSDMLVQFARRNLGVACVMEDFAKPYLESGELFALRLEKELPGRQICLAVGERTDLSAAAGKLIELLVPEAVMPHRK